ncbi:rab11 family-interacting protein 3 isoform X2 [Tachysurus fulvidraco]|uniref:rab11 family-interacting protein 3 isoform X2 n=1 Tax=Tachysurus fulvidraco TaxID=1234273 RepID=UPI001FEFD376|nr:rab11 family-interacting protein 3 isoform X2 [Tachysurus fulvidraco]
MEQVLSSPRGRSDWESDQNSLGFLLLDNGDVAAESGHENPERHQRGEPGIVSLSFDEIFQDSSLNLDELFRASRYSGLEQAYSWECTSERVGPSWDKQRSLSQEPAAEDCCETSQDVVTADLINFNSTTPSPTHTCTSLQAVESLQPVETDRPLDGLLGRLPLGPVLDQAPSQTLPARRTSVVDESPDSHRTKDLSSSQTTPENTTNVLCGNLTGLAEESASRNPLEALVPLPFIYDLSSSPHCSLSHADDSDELLPSSFLDSLVQPCDGSHAIFQTADTTTAGSSSEQEDDIPSTSNMTPDEASKVWSRPQSPADSLASSTLSVPERTLAGLDSEGKQGAPHESLSPNGTPESSFLGFSHNFLCEDEMTVEMEEAVERDLTHNEPVEQELGSDFDQAFLSSRSFIPEPTSPVESVSISQVSLSPQTGRSPESSNHELYIKSETATDLKENSSLSVIFASEKDIIVNTFPALEKEPPPISPSSCLSLEANAMTDAISLGPESQTRTSSELELEHNPSETTNMPEDTGKELTINLPNVDTSVTETRTLVAVDTHLLLHVQEVASVNTSINGTTRHCQDSDGCTNTQDESECLCSGTRNYTPEKDIHVMFDGLQYSHTPTESSDSGLNTHTPDHTTLPAPGSPEVEAVCVQQGEREGSYSDPGAFFGSGLDPTLLSGADSPLSQLGRAMEQERGGATSRLCQSADVKVDGETDLPDQADLSQVAQPRVNPLRDESPSGVCPLEETCPPLMGDDDVVVIPDGPDDAEMALEICVSSDLIQDGSVGASALPAANPQDDERSALQAVFQALDQDGDGFVRIEEFMEFATAYGVEQVKDLTRFLDPSGLGVISFEDFHRGITAIGNGGSDPDLYKLQLTSGDAAGAAEEYDEQAEVSDSAYLGSESAYSECETFTDEDTGALVHPELHEDVETDSGIETTLAENEDRNRFSLGSDLHGHALVAVIGGEEEHFEDFGESNSASDLLLANEEEGRAAPEGEGAPELHLHTGSPVHRSSMLLSPSFQNFLQSESLEFFCTHCHKQFSRLEDLSTRLHFLEMNSSSKRLSSKKAARHLLQTSGLDGMNDLSRDILDLADSDITDKVLLLERRVSELEKDSAASEEQHARLRQENLTLVHRANALEEQLKEQELHADETFNTLARKHRDALSKLQRERELEIENLQARLQQLDEENSELRSCVPCLRANIERLEEEKRKLQDEVDDVTDRLNEEMESRRKMADKLSHERHTSQKEKETTQELIEDLRKQLEMLQLFKLEMEARRGRSPAAGLQEYNTHMRENELEQEIRRLKQDNRSLKEQNDELNGQIINLSIQGAKSLFTESLSESLAAEINNVSRTELMEAIKKQEEINFRLQDYIDRIIVAIMESNPSILEVK